jgi:hypothetical protein
VSWLAAGLATQPESLVLGTLAGFLFLFPAAVAANFY